MTSLKKFVHSKLDNISTLEAEDTLSLLKQIFPRIDTILDEAYECDQPIQRLLHLRAILLDKVLVNLWGKAGFDSNFALVATGGYGRGELHPHSDIDLLILYRKRLTKKQTHILQTFLTLLWDMGLHVGHSVRTPANCEQEAKSDITIVTCLMEARLLSGNQTLYRDLIRRMQPDRIWSCKNFFAAKYEEQQQRYQKFADTAYNVEPNIKECPGGLRDIQMISWFSQRYFNVAKLHDLIAIGFLSQQEYHSLYSGLNMLCHIRYGLHLLAQRREERLLFDYQKKIAQQLGYIGKNNSGVESFMRNYYNVMRETHCLTEMLLQQFREKNSSRWQRQKISDINRNFHIRDGAIEARHSKIFSNNPFRLLELFLLIQTYPEIKGVRADTIRLVRQQIKSIDDNFRKDIRARSYFIEILRQPGFVGQELRRMHRYGVLGAYLPVFSRIQGHMQFDLFHVYTVDEHSLTVVHNLHLFSQPECEKKFPLCYEIMKKIPKQEILYIAGLFHDIAKGRSGDHSELGAREATRFCKEHQLSEYDTRLITWLVRYHLFMSQTAQKKDIDNAEVITNFTARVVDQNYLNHLYLLTVADICATNPDLWNEWRASLLEHLYHECLLRMRRGREKAQHRNIRIKDNKSYALDLLQCSTEQEEAIRNLWKQLHTDYFLRHTPTEIAWHADGIIKHTNKPLPLILVQRDTGKGWSEIFVYTRDQTGLFTATVHALEALRLNVHDARIITSKHGYTLDTYVVMEAEGGIIHSQQRANELARRIHSELSDNTTESAIKKQSVLPVPKRKLRSFEIPTQVAFTMEEKGKRLVMEVNTLDRVGVLSRVGRALEHCQMRLLGAKIATYGERVEDIFYLQCSDCTPCSDTNMSCLKDSIISSLSNF